MRWDFDSKALRTPSFIYLPQCWTIHVSACEAKRNRTREGAQSTWKPEIGSLAVGMSIFTDLRELPILIAFIKRKVDSWLVGIWNVSWKVWCIHVTIFQVSHCLMNILSIKPKNSNFWMPYVSYAKNGAYVDISRCRWLHIYTNPTYIDIPRSDAKPSNPRYWPAGICIAVSIACSTTFVDRCQIRVWGFSLR